MARNAPEACRLRPPADHNTGSWSPHSRARAASRLASPVRRAACGERRAASSVCGSSHSPSARCCATLDYLVRGVRAPARAGHQHGRCVQEDGHRCAHELQEGRLLPPSHAQLAAVRRHAALLVAGHPASPCAAWGGGELKWAHGLGGRPCQGMPTGAACPLRGCLARGDVFCCAQWLHT